jgi:hypothetical protein
MFSSFAWYRRMRGGRWARVTGFLLGRRWVRLPEGSLERYEECWVNDQRYCPRCLTFGPNSYQHGERVCPTCDLIRRNMALTKTLAEVSKRFGNKVWNPGEKGPVILVSDYLHWVLGPE